MDNGTEAGAGIVGERGGLQSTLKLNVGGPACLDTYSVYGSNLVRLCLVWRQDKLFVPALATASFHIWVSAPLFKCSFNLDFSFMWNRINNSFDRIRHVRVSCVVILIFNRCELVILISVVSKIIIFRD